MMTATSENPSMDPSMMESTGLVADTSLEEGLSKYAKWLASRLLLSVEKSG
ncbi:MAG: hypothetical protein ACLFS8_00160 [Clostridia bacterium]